MGVGTWSYDRMHQVLLASQIQAATTVILPSWPALLLAALSIAAKEWLFKVTKKVGDALNSQVIIANAWHHRSDAFSSVLSMASIGMAIFLPGLLVADSAAGILIAGMICMTGMEILLESVKQLTDTSDQSLTLKIDKLERSVEGVQDLKALRARTIGRLNHQIIIMFLVVFQALLPYFITVLNSGSLVDMTLLVDQKISSSAAMAIAERVRWKIIEDIPSVMVSDHFIFIF